MSDTIPRSDLVALTSAKKAFAVVARSPAGVRQVCFQGDDLAETRQEAQKPGLDDPRLYKCVNDHWSPVKPHEGLSKAKKARP